ncbi:uroporphyrin-III methyltransferase [Bacillus sp. SA1-12]|uniref:DUF488 domain-containing protein n=1 Tax=Bacillus sp. SA1-12 TaxID=1455638 RepID=UPI0006272537|nr:DUF488 family protein [Bacillus sp. SA1-12]KKI89556.1 uroporphyrin-III methyltransferase [Bacillus sp. SA1-12]
MPVKIKRAYEKSSKEDGIRVLVDRIWPRGLSKQEINIDHWMKDVAPSSQLRKWFNHEPSKFEAFKMKYIEELREDKKDLVKELREMAAEETVTLLYAAKDQVHNQAVVLMEMVDKQEVP